MKTVVEPPKTCQTCVFRGPQSLLICTFPHKSWQRWLAAQEPNGKGVVFMDTPACKDYEVRP